MEGKRVEVSSATGEVRYIQTTEAVVWRNITEQETVALARPGEEVPADLKVSCAERDGFFHIVPTSEYTKVVVFADNRIQMLEKTGEIRGERELAVYVIFCLVSVFLMLISNMVMWRARKNSVFVVVVVAVAAAAVAADTHNKRLYVVWTVIYYVAMAVVLFV